MSITLDGSNILTGGLINSGTAQASTSGTAITFTGIPSTAKRITVMFNGVSTSGTSNILIQVGSGSVITTGYTGQYNFYSQGSSSSGGTLSAGFLTINNNASGLNYGSAVIYNISGNTWVCSTNISLTVSGYVTNTNGIIALSGILDRVVITTVNGTDTFDAGSINILYE